MVHYEKLRLALRYYLLGKEYFVAVNALDYGASYHTGTRKNGITPEFQHQIEIAQYLRTLKLINPELAITVALLHDVKEDYNVTEHDLRRLFGDEVTGACILLDKNGKTKEEYYTTCAMHPVASVVKGGDRIHNIQTMVGVFTPEKQEQYITEVRTYILPMIKKAKRLFPQQEAAYENIKHMLVSQIELLEHILRAHGDKI